MWQITPEQTFDLTYPESWKSGVIIASPHSGADYPDWFRAGSDLDPMTLRSSEDAFVDQLVAGAAAAGAALLTARVPRAVVDVNRSEEELDPMLIEGIGHRPVGPRILAGLGVIPRVVSGGRTIHRGRLSMAEARWRLDHLWRPYHRALHAAIAEARIRFGGAILIDMHSMPRESLADLRAPRPDVVLGDRHGASAGDPVTRAVAAAFAAEGFRIARNSPFAGAHVAMAYGRPSNGIHVVQVEIDRSLYMDERTIRPVPGFGAFAARIDAVVARLARIELPRRDLPIAAE